MMNVVPSDALPPLSVITAHLLAHPSASMAELAQALGCSRSTLHRRFARRSDLIAAIEAAALDEVRALHDDAMVATWFTEEAASVADVITPYVDGLIAIGPQLLFLVRTSGEGVLFTPDVESLDDELAEAMARGQDAGLLSARLSASWLIESLHALVFTAWEQVDRGRLAEREATRSVVSTWVNGCSR
jgi:AcrR family transcriptional regulator